MKKRVIILLLLCISVIGKVYPQCDFSPTGIGAFESNKGWSFLSSNNAEYTIQSEVVHGGSAALKIWAKETNDWNIRMMNGCNLALQKNNAYAVSLWMKGTAGTSFGVALQANDVGTTVIREEIRTIGNTDWNRYTFLFYSDADYTKGKIKVTYKTTGTYYLDDLIMESVDCTGLPGGTAVIDDCGICSGGNTGITPNEFCNVYRIAPDNQDIRYTGAVYTSLTETSAELLRFTPAFLAIPSYGKWATAKARTQSGVTISFKTSSPYIVLNFSELEDSEIRTRNFAVFKNGVFQRDGIKTLSFEIVNTLKDEAVWTITLPVFSGVKFNGLELVQGYSLSTLAEDQRPVYVALGNSITHGVGQEEGTHLTYPFLLAESLDYQLYNLGIGGSRVTTQIVRNLDNLQPQLITVLWGYNDMNTSAPLADMFTEYEALLTSLLQKFPETYICPVLQTYTTTTVGGQNPSNTLEDLRNGQKQIVERLAVIHPKLLLFDAWDPTYGPENLADVVHLSKTGAANLSQALYEYLKTKIPTGLNLPGKSKENAWSVFPNPAKDKIYVKTDKPEGKEVSFFNTQGQLVYKRPLTHNEQPIDVTCLNAKGVYFLTLHPTDSRDEAVKLLVE